jgi:hypothetical protein
LRILPHYVGSHNEESFVKVTALTHSVLKRQRAIPVARINEEEAQRPLNAILKNNAADSD